MIKLTEILTVRRVPLDSYKLHLATYRPKGGPMEAFRNGEFQRWQEEQQNRNFDCDIVLGLIQMGGDRWLYAGAFRVLGVGPGTNTRWLYSTELLPDQEDLIGRVIVKFKRTFRSSYIHGSRFGQMLEVTQILEDSYLVDDFPGYNSVRLSYDQLKLIVSRSEPAWKSALSSINGVYLIVDKETGKGYVGSAYGIGGIWQRWSEYAATGHGGNLELVSLLDNEGETYADNFQYAVLEIADPQTPAEKVIDRENHWKEVLLTKNHGLNSN